MGGNSQMQAAGGKIGKPKHSNVKIHLLGGISRKGLTHLVMFTGRMYCIFKNQFAL